MDIVNPPAEYTAAKAKPITLPEMSATRAATNDMTIGNKSKIHNGGRGLLRGTGRRFDLASLLVCGRGVVSGCRGFSDNESGDVLERRVVSEKKRLMDAHREHKKNVPPMRSSVQYNVKCHIPDRQHTHLQ